MKMSRKGRRNDGTNLAVKSAAGYACFAAEDPAAHHAHIQGVALIGAVFFFQKMAVTVALNSAVSLPVRRLVALNSACTHFL